MMAHRIATRPEGEQAEWASDSVPKPSSRSRLTATTKAAPFLLTLLCLMGIGYGAAVARFGSLPRALRYLAGERLILGPARIEMHDLAVGQVRTAHLEFTNNSGKAVSILGASTPCTCLMVSDLPTTVEPGRSVRIPVEITGRADKPKLDEWVVLFTDSTIRRSFRVRVVATMKPGVAKADPRGRASE